METKTRRGRPKLPDGEKKVMFAKRVHPSKVAAIEALLKADRLDGPQGQKAVESKLGASAGFVERHEGLFGNLALSECRDQTKALLDDVDRLEKEKADLRARLDKCSEASDDQKTHWWKLKYEAVVAKYGANEFDQS